MSDPASAIQNGSANGRRLGVMFVGAGGAVASTVVAGVLAARGGAAEPLGMLTEDRRWEPLHLLTLDGLSFGGWDISREDLEGATRRHGVVPSPLIEAIGDDLAAVLPLPGVADSGRASAERLIDDIDRFRLKAGVHDVVVVCLSSTAPPVDLSLPVFQHLDSFELGLDAADPAIPVDAVYAYAALCSGCAVLNFTPNVSVEVPALLELADNMSLPVAGKDGKTGQTLVKTVIAPMLAMRELRVEGWYSTNILGNNDGKVLSDPEHVRSKIETKSGVLEGILGRSDFSHLVRIDYFPPQGDAKEAWDNILFRGWLGERMSMRIDWQGKDSILAAPLIVDIVRLLDLARRQGCSGVQQQLGCFFKAPYQSAEHNFFRQYETLVAYLEQSLEAAVPVAAGAEAG
ncbi:MAG TPA: inositol-3-phosphate synthase [Thermoleophilaceae bacterium]|jgi:myo-inositol-1-phosphate synthase